MNKNASQPGGSKLSRPQAALSALVEAIFPSRCIICGRAGALFCADCRSQTPPLERARLCPRCGAALRRGGVCPVCASSPAPLAAVQAAASFEGRLRQALHALKYKGQYQLALDLAALVVARTDVGQWEIDGIAGVPAHKKREAQRGYNQAGMLARALAQQLGWPEWPDALRRVRSTRSQVGLNYAARQANVQGAFEALPRRVQGQRVLLVDDVYTTGATLRACAEALAAAGASEVRAVTVGRAPLR